MSVERPGPHAAWSRGRLIAVIVGALALAYAIFVGVVVLGGGPDASPSQENAVLLAVGDLGGPDSTEASAVAKLISEHRMDALALLGDLGTRDGSEAAWQTDFQPRFGSFGTAMRPTPGDVEYAMSGAADYSTYFKSHAGGFAAAPYYAFTLGSWRIYSLNSQIGEGEPGSAMYEWLRGDLIRTAEPCVAAFWHQPVWTVGPSAQDAGGMSLIYQLLGGSGADIVLAAHDENYQRWNPIDGITSFVVGTGGAGRQGATRSDDRLAVVDTAPGIVQLSLQPGSAEYQFVRTDGTVHDAGKLRCHGRVGDGPPRPATPTGLTSRAAADGVQLTWQPVSGEPAAIGYLVYRGSEVLGFTREASYTDTSLPPGASVLYAVRSVAASGARSVPSESVHSGGDAPGYTDYTWAVGGANPSAPTADKPQSKLWYADGSWWGILFGPDPAQPGRSAYFIQRFSTEDQSWTNTGIQVDERDRSRADALWDDASQKLYVVSTIASGSIKLYRYSYASGAYSLDEGFPLRLTEHGSESATIGIDSTGRLWVTMTQVADGSGACADEQPCVVKVMHSTDADYHWTVPMTIATDGSSVKPDDISALVSYGGSRIGVAWSNQLDSAFYFASHADGAADTAWSLERLDIAPRGADDHINLKADGAGRVYLIGKTSLNDPANASPTQPLMVLFVRAPDGTWRDATIWTVRDDVTRAQVLVDEAAGRIYAVAAQPGAGGAIYMKAASLADLDFGTGLGTVLMAGGEMNNPTSTKQTVDLREGILILASDSTTHTYWHNLLAPDTVPGGG